MHTLLLRMSIYISRPVRATLAKTPRCLAENLLRAPRRGRSGRSGPPPQSILNPYTVTLFILLVCQTTWEILGEDIHFATSGSLSKAATDGANICSQQAAAHNPEQRI